MLFTEPDLFLVANQVPQPDSPGWASVLCENFAENRAICACGSSEDAMLNAILISKPDKRYYSIHAGRFVLAVFILDHSGMLRLHVHLGCQACDGRLIARRSARPTTRAMRHKMVVPPERTRHIYGRLDEDTAHECQQLYNSVDLLAIHECFERAARWPLAAGTARPSSCGGNTETAALSPYWHGLQSDCAPRHRRRAVVRAGPCA